MKATWYSRLIACTAACLVQQEKRLHQFSSDFLFDSVKFKSLSASIRPSMDGDLTTINIAAVSHQDPASCRNWDGILEFSCLRRQLWDSIWVEIRLLLSWAIHTVHAFHISLSMTTEACRYWWQTRRGKKKNLYNQIYKSRWIKGMREGILSTIHYVILKSELGNIMLLWWAFEEIPEHR